MARLTFKAIQALKERGRYADGDNLYLQVAKSESKSWVLRVQRDGRRQDLGLGGYPTVSLAEARSRAIALRSKVLKGEDPQAERRARANRPPVPVFADAARSRHDEVKRTFRNVKHSAQWLSSLETYAFPPMGKVPVNEVTGAMVRAALLPLWLDKPETARRVHQRIVDVLTWAVARGFREDVPLLTAKVLSLPRQARRIRHHSAMPWQEVPEFVRRLRAGNHGSVLVCQAVELLILTAARSGEIRGMTWSEVDLKGQVWRVPATRMKAGREHVIPLAGRTVQILSERSAQRVAASDLVFPGRSLVRPLSDMTLKMALRRMSIDHDPHGFRSSFRDWVADETSFPRELAEAALAHAVGDRTEAAYARSTMIAKRRVLMDAWAAYLSDEADTPVEHIVADEPTTVIEVAR